MGDAEYLAAFQQIVMPVAYEVCISVLCASNYLFQVRHFCLGLFVLRQVFSEHHVQDFVEFWKG